MKVFELMSILAEMDPEMEVVTPQAPYGEPTDVPDGYVNVIHIDTGESEMDLCGEYVGIGFKKKDEYKYTELDMLNEDAFHDMATTYLAERGHDMPIPMLWNEDNQEETHYMSIAEVMAGYAALCTTEGDEAMSAEDYVLSQGGIPTQKIGEETFTGVLVGFLFSLEDEEEKKPEEPEAWHDQFVPKSPEDFKNMFKDENTD